MLKNDLRIALLIDGDNAQPSLVHPILKTLTQYGQCVIRRVYGDWTTPNLSGWRKYADSHAIQLVQQSRYTSGKNATDIALTIAAMEILHSGKVDAFCIVSSDSDFTPLVVRLKDEGATVIAVGKPTTPQSFVNACSVFIPTDTLITPQKPPTQAATPKKTKAVSSPGTPPAAQPPLKKAPKLPTKTAASKPAKVVTSPTTFPDARSLLKKAYEMSSKTDEWVLMTHLGSTLHQIDPNFATKTYGQKDLSHLVAQYLDVFEVRKEQSNAGTSRVYVKLKES